MVGLEATLALTGGSGGVSGDRRTRMGHTCPLPGSMPPQGALCPKLARFTVRLPLQTGKDRALNKRRGTNLVLNGGLGGLSGARWTHIGHTYPLPGHMVPKGALCPSTPASPIAHPNGHPPVKRVSLGHKALWGAILPGSGQVCPIRVRRSPETPPEPPVRARVASEPTKKEPKRTYQTIARPRVQESTRFRQS